MHHILILVSGSALILSRKIVCWVASAWLLLLIPNSTLAAPGDADPTFSATLMKTENPKSIIVQESGRVVTMSAGGALARFHQDGRRDEGYGASLPTGFRTWQMCAGAGEELYVYLRSLDDGLAIVVRLNADGGLDNSFKVEMLPGEWISSLAVQQDGKLLVWASSAWTQRVVRFHPDGSPDESFGPVIALGLCLQLVVLADAKVLLAGTLRVGSPVERSLVLLHEDGSIDTEFGAGGNLGPGCIGMVIPLRLGGLAAIRDYARVGEPEMPLVRLDTNGNRDFQFNSGAIDRMPEFVAEDAHGRLLIAGRFHRVQNSSRKHAARLNLDGSLDSGFVLGVPSSGFSAAAATSEGQLVIAGVGTNNQPFLVRLEGGEWPSGPPQIVSQPVSQAKRVGEDMSIEVVARATPNPVYQWHYNGQPLWGQTNSFLTLTNLQLLQTGTYSAVVSNSLGSTWSSPAHLLVNPPLLGPGSVDLGFNMGAGLARSGTSSGVVLAIALQGEKIVIAGSFDSYDGQVARGIARLNHDGSFDPTFTAGSGGSHEWLEALVVDAEEKVYVGGSFGRFNGQTRRNLVRLNPDGTLDDSFSPPLFSTQGHQTVRALSLQADGNLLVAGCFDQGCIQSILRLRSDGSPDETWAAPDLNMIATDIAVQKDGRVIVAGYTPGLEKKGFIRRLTADGHIDDSFAAFSVDEKATKILLLDDERIIAGLDFPARFPPFSQYVSYFALLPNGEVDTSFAATNSIKLIAGVTALLRFDSESFLVGGQSFIRRCDNTGIVDPIFHASHDQWPFAMVRQADGNVLVGGGFTRINRITRRGIARLYGTEQIMAPTILGPFMSSEGFHMSVPTAANRTFTLELKDSLHEPEWRPAASIDGDGGWQTLKDNAPAAPQRFYRVRVH
jgi:uncharacterized delta-60 repeat protein